MASTTEGISPIKKLERSYPCREIQIQQLAGFLSVSASIASSVAYPDSRQTSYSSPSTLVVHGLEATGKSEITAGILDALEVPHAIVNSRECITARHLLEQTVSAVVAALSGKATRSIQSARCESLAALLVQLESLLKNVPKFVLVFDGLDRQREAPPTLFAALARFGETACSPLFSVKASVTDYSHRSNH
jgi:origin recognition complex subunit 5